MKKRQHNAPTKKLNSLAKASGVDVLGFADASVFERYRLSHSIRRDPRRSLPNAGVEECTAIQVGKSGKDTFTLP